MLGRLWCSRAGALLGQLGRATCRYLDEVLVDPFGEGFLLDTVSLICKRAESRVRGV